MPAAAQIPPLPWQDTNVSVCTWTTKERTGQSQAAHTHEHKPASGKAGFLQAGRQVVDNQTSRETQLECVISGKCLFTIFSLRASTALIQLAKLIR